MESEYRAAMRRCVDTLIGHDALQGMSVLMFGHCNATEETIDYLAQSGIAAEAVMDNSAAKQGMSCRGVPVVAPSEIARYSGASSIVLIATRFFAEMSAQLRRLGYDGAIVQAVEYDSFAEYSLSAETLERRIDRMQRGAHTLERIRAAYPNALLIACPYNALGDVYWAMAFLPAYCQRHGIRETAVITTGEGCRQVAAAFGAENIVALERADMDELVQAIIFTREENAIIAHHDRPYTDNIIRWLDRHFLSFIDYYRRAVYGLPEDASPAAPTALFPFAGAERFAEGKTVIIAPYAKSVIAPPAAFWERLAQKYRRDGYMVFTNVNGDERPIAGTEPLAVPLNQLKAAAEYAGCFIGLRSGLCDMLYAAAACRKIVVFPNYFFSNTPHKAADFYALPGWERVFPD